MMLTQRIHCSFEYPVYFTRDVFGSENMILNDTVGRGNGAFFIDSGVVHARPHTLTDIDRWLALRPGGCKWPVTVVEGGEQCKNNLMLIHRVSQVIHHAALDRHCHVVIIGGGAVLDAVGFTASITHSGIRQIRIPTTVLSQNCSCVEVRNAVNYSGTKNFFGTFAPPVAVVNDFEFLRTLSQRDWVAGVAEAFKVAILKDRPYLDFLISNASSLSGRDTAVMEHLIVECARLHAEHTGQGGDPFELKNTRPLDFGHWCAHWLEMRTSHQLRHGEAVAIGIILDLKLAENRGLIDPAFSQRVIDAMHTAGLPGWHSALLHQDLSGRLSLYEGLESFRQHLGGELSLIVPTASGEPGILTGLTSEEIQRAVESIYLDVQWRKGEAGRRESSHVLP